MLDWDEAERHLKACEAMYAAIGSAGLLTLMCVIIPLRDRFNSGERTKELHEAVMNIA